MIKITSEGLKKWATIIGSVTVILGGLTGGALFTIDKFLRPAWAEDISSAIAKTLEENEERFRQINRNITSQSHILQEQSTADARTEAEIKALRKSIDQQNELLKILIQKD